VLSKGDVHNMRSSGSRGLEMRTPDVNYIDLEVLSVQRMTANVFNMSHVKCIIDV